MVGLDDNDILNDELFKEIASEINGVTPEQLSDYLGFEGLQAPNAKMLSSASLKSAFEILLGIFVRENGKGTGSAKKLRLIFLEKDMEPCAKAIDKALRNYGITVSSRADTRIGLSSNYPYPPHHTPELEKTGIVNPSHADTTTYQDIDPPSPPHEKPGSETPMDTDGHGPQPPDRAVEQETPSISGTIPTYLKFTAFIVIIFAIYIFLFRH